MKWLNFLQDIIIYYEILQPLKSVALTTLRHWFGIFPANFG